MKQTKWHSSRFLSDGLQVLLQGKCPLFCVWHCRVAVLAAFSFLFSFLTTVVSVGRYGSSCSLEIRLPRFGIRHRFITFHFASNAWSPVQIGIMAYNKTEQRNIQTSMCFGLVRVLSGSAAQILSWSYTVAWSCSMSTVELCVRVWRNIRVQQR